MRILALYEDLVSTVGAAHGMIPMILFRMLSLLLQHLLFLLQILQLLIDPPLANAASSPGLAPATIWEDQRQWPRIHLVGNADLLFLHILDLAVFAAMAGLTTMTGFGLATGLALDDDLFLVGRAGAGTATLLFLDSRMRAAVRGAPTTAAVVGVMAGFVDGEMLGFVLRLGPTTVFALTSSVAFAATVVGFGSSMAVAATSCMATAAQGTAHLVPFADGAWDVGCVFIDDDFSALDDFPAIGRRWWSFDGVGDAF